MGFSFDYLIQGFVDRPVVAESLLGLGGLFHRDAGRGAPRHRSRLRDRHPAPPDDGAARDFGDHHDGGDLLRRHVRGLDDGDRRQHPRGGLLRPDGDGRLRDGQAGEGRPGPGHLGHRLVCRGNAQRDRADLLCPDAGRVCRGLRPAGVLRPDVHGTEPRDQPLGPRPAEGGDLHGPRAHGRPDRPGPAHRGRPAHLRDRRP